jgi:lisH domain-containing protein FOPNL
MASLEDLKSALKITLENKGVLQQVKAQIRAEIFNSLDEQVHVRLGVPSCTWTRDCRCSTCECQETEKPQLSSENILINELIREYLEYNHHFHTVAVLLPGTRCSSPLIKPTTMLM